MKKNKIDIVYQDKFLIVANKPAHLLSVATDKEKDKTFFHQVLSYEKSKHKSNKVFIVHRLDKDTSGLMIFAKDEKTKHHLQEHWEELVKRRGYLAVVEGKMEKTEDTIKSFLKETSTLMTYSSTKNDGKLAITKYKTIKQNSHYALLDIEIKTGRKNQIRVHMQDINHPVVGDKKYGAKKNPLKRLGLHANYLSLTHPVTKQELVFESKVPKIFLNLFEQK